MQRARARLRRYGRLLAVVVVDGRNEYTIGVAEFRSASVGAVMGAYELACCSALLPPFVHFVQPRELEEGKRENLDGRRSDALHRLFFAALSHLIYIMILSVAQLRFVGCKISIFHERYFYHAALHFYRLY